ncbi:MAG TPA: Rrf2 family transcriptional regulator [Elusimicrobiota bacterium]|nr:Rrf2 family transcriptional regulator [Elusimicrobiota bacterium]
MAANSRFSVAVHIMTALAYLGDEKATSVTLAASANTNPVVVRRLLSHLHQAGLVDCHQGKSGGCQLARSPGRITLHDIYMAIEAGGPFVIPHKPENKACAVSCHMKQILEEIFQQTQQAIARSLERTTLADLLKTVLTPA